MRFLPGIGPRRMQHFRRLGITTIEDLLYHLPRRYEDRRALTPIQEVAEGRTVVVQGRITTCRHRRSRRGLSIVEASVEDATGRLPAVWFNQPYLTQYLTVGREVILHGKVERYTRLQLVAPEFELLDEGEEGPDRQLHLGRIVPIYPATAEMHQRLLRAAVATALATLRGRLIDPIPQTIRRRQELWDLPRALETIHFPRELDDVAPARRRLVFEEWWFLQLALELRRRWHRTQTKSHRYTLDGPLTQALAQGLPFTLTPDQVQAKDEILEDLARPHPMRRLLQGEVGSGKTIVALWAALVAIQSHYQVAVMVPTEVLAEQQATVLARLLEPLGVRVGRLTSELRAPQRAALRYALANGSLQLVVGTHALLARGVQFKALRLVIIDEQHKFGVLQRSLLPRKGTQPDLLVMTATPIPRTLALTIYGDLDCSTIRMLPPGRLPVTTRWMREAERPTLYEHLRQTLAAGRQAYVVYPTIEASARSDLRAATQMFRHLRDDIFPAFRVALLHGRMAAEEQSRIVTAFHRGEVALLVSTSVVEVGIDVPNATCMVIEHAERFGLAQLHQLRGRIGRGTAQAECLMLSESDTDAVRARLQALVDIHNGFELAERDLQLRGPGEFFGTEQHGWPAFRVVNPATDLPLADAAKREARQVLDDHPWLDAPQWRLVREHLRQRYREVMGQPYWWH